MCLISLCYIFERKQRLLFKLQLSASFLEGKRVKYQASSSLVSSWMIFYLLLSLWNILYFTRLLFPQTGKCDATEYIQDRIFYWFHTAAVLARFWWIYPVCHILSLRKSPITYHYVNTISFLTRNFCGLDTLLPSNEVMQTSFNEIDVWFETQRINLTPSKIIKRNILF